jgi:hypothetical protein
LLFCFHNPSKSDRISALTRILIAQFINRARSQLICITDALAKDSIQVKSREKLTLLNENVTLILELVNFNPLSADDPKFADSIRQIIINAGE